MFFKKQLKPFVPPFFLDLLSKNKMSKWQGNFDSWQEAIKNSDGYDNPDIFNKIKSAALSVRNGEFPFERDSVLFDQIQYSWPILTGLLWCALKENSTLNVIDYGGSLGSSYHQNKKFLSSIEFSWNIIEQKHFVDFGQKNLTNDNLSFYENIDQCMQDKDINICLLSSVLPYIESPYDLINEIHTKNIKYVLIDKTFFIKGKKDRICVQEVPSNIYKASYPCRIFAEESFFNFLKKRYKVVETFELKSDLPFAETKGCILEILNA